MMLANIPLRILWLAFLQVLQRFFLIYTSQPLLSTFSPALIENSSTFSPTVQAPRILDPSAPIHLASFSSICLVPPLGSTLLAMHFSFPVDYLDYDLHHAPSSESPHDYEFTDTLVQQPTVPHEGAPSTPALPQVGDHHTQSNMAPYGAHGLSFCPVMVGITYIQSLLHLYMLLMIPSVFNHWFEDLAAYDTIDPTQVLDGGWLLCANLWALPKCLFRCGLRKVVPCLRRQFRRVVRKTERPPIPRIVVVRVDGEAVPVHFGEDNQAGVGACLEPTDLKVQHVTCKGGVKTAGVEAVSTQMVSQQGSNQGGITEMPEDGIGLATEEIQLSVNGTRDGLENSFALIETAQERFRSVEKDNPVLDAHVTSSADLNVVEGMDEYDQVALQGNDEIFKHGAGSLEEREDSNEELAFVQWSLVNDLSLEEPRLETQSKSANGTSLSVGTQDTPTSTKNMRFITGDAMDVEDHWHVPLGTRSNMDECTHAENMGSELEDGGVTLVRISAVPFDSSTETDTGTPEEVTSPVLPVIFSEERFENDIVIVEYLSPSSSGQPIVNLPPLVATRREEVKEARFVETDPIMVPAEDIATSPVQTPSPIRSPVAIGLDCLANAGEEQNTEPLRTEDSELLCVVATLDCAGSQDDTTYETLESLFSEVGSRTFGPSAECSNPVCLPRVESEACPDNVGTPEIAPISSESSVETDLQTTNTTVVTMDTGLQAAIEVPATKVVCETLQYFLDGPDEQSRNEIPGPEADIPDTPSTRSRWPTVSVPLMELSTDARAFGEESDNVPQHFSSSGDFVTDSPMTKSPERLSGLLDAGNEGDLLSTIPTETICSKWDHESWRDTGSMPREHTNIMSRPSPNRTLSGSIHAPSSSSPVPQANGDIDRTTVYEMSSSMDRPLPLPKPDEGEKSTGAIAKNATEHQKGLSASIHAPQRSSEVEAQAPFPRSQDENYYHSRRVVTNPAVVSEKEPETKLCPPNWAAMPDVIDAFHMFKQAPSGKTIPRVSSIVDCTNRGPMFGIVGQKGIATNSLNNTSAIANLQSRWMHGRGLLLVRDLVPSDPADFNLRPCTNLRMSNIRGTNAIAVQQMLYPVRTDGKIGSVAPDPTDTQRQQGAQVNRRGRVDPECTSFA